MIGRLLKPPYCMISGMCLCLSPSPYTSNGGATPDS